MHQYHRSRFIVTTTRPFEKIVGLGSVGQHFGRMEAAVGGMNQINFDRAVSTVLASTFPDSCPQDIVHACLSDTLRIADSQEMSEFRQGIDLLCTDCLEAGAKAAAEERRAKMAE